MFRAVLKALYKLSKLKAIFKNIINNAQEILTINALSEDEFKGQLNSLSFLKFFKGSLLSVPFSLGRSIRGVKFDNTVLDPFSLCLAKQNINKFDANTFADDLHDIIKVENNFLVKNFIKGLTRQDIANYPSWTIAFPWEENSFYDLKTNYQKLLMKNREPYSQSRTSKNSFSMYSKEIALSHGIQYRNLIQKITVEGFDSKYPRPRIYLLKDQNNWRWVMGGNGNHRAYIMSALRYSTLPVSVIKVVDRSKSSQWNNVLNGNYTKREAEEIFDTVFRGDSCLRGSY